MTRSALLFLCLLIVCANYAFARQGADGLNEQQRLSGLCSNCRYMARKSVTSRCSSGMEDCRSSYRSIDRAKWAS